MMIVVAYGVKGDSLDSVYSSMKSLDDSSNLDYNFENMDHLLDLGCRNLPT